MPWPGFSVTLIVRLSSSTSRIIKLPQDFSANITLCSMLRIPVCMHNVEEDQIFRPASWNAFGMDKEGADFRACKNYGPIYK